MKISVDGHEMDSEDLPAAYVVIPVIVSLTEWTAIQDQNPAALTAEGTASASFRTSTGMTETPYGLKAALRKRAKR